MRLQQNNIIEVLPKYKPAGSKMSFKNCYFFFLAFIGIQRECLGVPSLRKICLKYLAQEIANTIDPDPELPIQETFSKIETHLDQLPIELKDAVALQLGHIAFSNIFPLLKLHTHRDKITSLIFNPQNNILVSTSLDEKVTSYNVDKNVHLDQYSGPLTYTSAHSSNPIICTKPLTACFTKSGTLLVGTDSGHLGIQESENEKINYLHIWHNAPTSLICARDCDDSIFLASKKSCIFYNTQNKKYYNIGVLKKRITATASSLEKNLFAIGLSDGTIKIYKKNKEITKLKLNKHKIIYLKFLENKLFCVDREGNIMSWEPDVEKNLFFIKTSSIGYKIMCYTVSPYGTLYAFAHECDVQITNLKYKKKNFSTISFDHPITHLAFNHNETIIVGGDDKGNIFIAPLPHDLSLDQTLFLLIYNSLQNAQMPNNIIIQKLKQLLRNNNAQTDLFNPAISKALHNKLEKLEWERKTKKIVDVMEKSKNWLKNKLGN